MYIYLFLIAYSHKELFALVKVKSKKENSQREFDMNYVNVIFLIFERVNVIFCHFGFFINFEVNGCIITHLRVDFVRSNLY